MSHRMLQRHICSLLQDHLLHCQQQDHVQEQLQLQRQVWVHHRINHIANWHIQKMMRKLLCIFWMGWALIRMQTAISLAQQRRVSKDMRSRGTCQNSGKKLCGIDGIGVLCRIITMPRSPLLQIGLRSFPTRTSVEAMIWSRSWLAIAS